MGDAQGIEQTRQFFLIAGGELSGNEGTGAAGVDLLVGQSEVEGLPDFPVVRQQAPPVQVREGFDPLPVGVGDRRDDLLDERRLVGMKLLDGEQRRSGRWGVGVEGGRHVRHELLQQRVGGDAPRLPLGVGVVLEVVDAPPLRVVPEQFALFPDLVELLRQRRVRGPLAVQGDLSLQDPPQEEPGHRHGFAVPVADGPPLDLQPLQHLLRAGAVAGAPDGLHLVPVPEHAGDALVGHRERRDGGVLLVPPHHAPLPVEVEVDPALAGQLHQVHFALALDDLLETGQGDEGVRLDLLQALLHPVQVPVEPLGVLGVPDHPAGVHDPLVLLRVRDLLAEGRLVAETGQQGGVPAVEPPDLPSGLDRCDLVGQVLQLENFLAPGHLPAGGAHLPDGEEPVDLRHQLLTAQPGQNRIETLLDLIFQLRHPVLFLVELRHLGQTVPCGETDQEPVGGRADDGCLLCGRFPPVVALDAEERRGEGRPRQRRDQGSRARLRDGRLAERHHLAGGRFVDVALVDGLTEFPVKRVGELLDQLLHDLGLVVPGLFFVAVALLSQGRQVRHGEANRVAPVVPRDGQLDADQGLDVRAGVPSEHDLDGAAGGLPLQHVEQAVLLVTDRQAGEEGLLGEAEPDPREAGNRVLLQVGAPILLRGPPRPVPLINEPVVGLGGRRPDLGRRPDPGSLLDPGRRFPGRHFSQDLVERFGGCAQGLPRAGDVFQTHVLRDQVRHRQVGDLVRERDVVRLRVRVQLGDQGHGARVGADKIDIDPYPVSRFRVVGGVAD